MLEFKNFTLTYESSGGKFKTILEQINLQFEKGSVNVLTGESGCGKTSLIQVINGIIPEITLAKLTGEMNFNGESLLDKDVTTRSQWIATVFQNPKNQFYAVNSLDEIAFGLENRNVPRKEILQSIDHYTKLLGTEKLLNRDLLKLSGGEKQLVAITSVAALDNDIYIFDEPSASLDRESIGKLKSAIAKLKQLGKIIIIAEHRLYYLKDILDQLIVIENNATISYDKKDVTTELLTNHHLRCLGEIEEDDLDATSFAVKHLNDKNYQATDRLKCLDFYCKYRGTDRIIYDFSLSFDSGIYFIIGENGIGKSSFLRQVCGLNRKMKGQLIYDETLIKRRNEWISLVMQDVNYQLFTESVESEISIVTEDMAKKEAILREMGLWDKREAHPQSLSGGEKQRLSIALALASSKPIVILDEPTSGLCLKNMGKLVKWLKELKEEGKVILIVTHDYEFIKMAKENVVKFVK